MFYPLSNTINKIPFIYVQFSLITIQPKKKKNTAYIKKIDKSIYAAAAAAYNQQ